MRIDTTFTNFPFLTTTRLRLRQVTLADADAVFAFKSDPQVTSAYGQEPKQSIEEMQAWLQQLIDGYDRREVLFWIITRKEEDRAIGVGGFWNFSPGFHCAEIGYELHPAHWGKGLMPEAVTAMLAYGFQEMGLHRVEANPLAGNDSSHRLLQKLGFRHEGTLRQRHFFRGQFIDQLYYGLLSEEWEGR